MGRPCPPRFQRLDMCRTSIPPRLFVFPFIGESAYPNCQCWLWYWGKKTNLKYPTPVKLAVLTPTRVLTLPNTAAKMTGESCISREDGMVNVGAEESRPPDSLSMKEFWYVENDIARIYTPPTRCG
jgi:hypothetical protein